MNTEFTNPTVNQLFQMLITSHNNGRSLDESLTNYFRDNKTSAIRENNPIFNYYNDNLEDAVRLFIMWLNNTQN